MNILAPLQMIIAKMKPETVKRLKDILIVVQLPTLAPLGILFGAIVRTEDLSFWGKCFYLLPPVFFSVFLCTFVVLLQFQNMKNMDAALASARQELSSARGDPPLH